jgi:uncharacterized membrane protein (UPF0127 family)
MRIITVNSFWERLVGLMGKRELPDDVALEFPNTRAIHTFFMRFPIDVVFVGKDRAVRAVYRNVKPWRIIVGPSGCSAVEMVVGASNKLTDGTHLV